MEIKFKVVMQKKKSKQKKKKKKKKGKQNKSGMLGKRIMHILGSMKY